MMKERVLQFASVTCMILLAAAASAGAEHGGHHRMHHGDPGMLAGGHDLDRMIEHLSQMLELTDTQLQAIRNITEAARPEADALRERAQANREAMHALSVTDADYDTRLQNLANENGEVVTLATLLHGRLMAQINAQLTAEQQAKLAESRDKMRMGLRHRWHSDDATDDPAT
jgi:Spy/CpxP family protein refolding chaperone